VAGWEKKVKGIPLERQEEIKCTIKGLLFEIRDEVEEAKQIVETHLNED